jgi:flagellar biosynthesis protein FlhA
VDTLGLEVGYRLIPLVDKSQGGELLRRIKGIRKKFAQEVGFYHRRCTFATILN